MCCIAEIQETQGTTVLSNVGRAHNERGTNYNELYDRKRKMFKELPTSDVAEYSMPGPRIDWLGSEKVGVTRRVLRDSIVLSFEKVDNFLITPLRSPMKLDQKNRSMFAKSIRRPLQGIVFGSLNVHFDEIETF